MKFNERLARFEGWTRHPKLDRWQTGYRGGWAYALPEYCQDTAKCMRLLKRMQEDLWSVEITGGWKSWNVRLIRGDISFGYCDALFEFAVCGVMEKFLDYQEERKK